VSIWGLSWPWRTKKGRTVERYDKLGRLRVLCANSGSPATGEIAFRDSNWTLAWDGQPVESRWTPCPECDCSIRVVGPKSKPRLGVHKGNKTR
jgi:hypothetical protein